MSSSSSINAEQIQMIYYKPNEWYLAHYDGWKMPDDPNGEAKRIGSSESI